MPSIMATSLRWRTHYARTNYLLCISSASAAWAWHSSAPVCFGCYWCLWMFWRKLSSNFCYFEISFFPNKIAKYNIRSITRDTRYYLIMTNMLTRAPKVPFVTTNALKVKNGFNVQNIDFAPHPSDHKSHFLPLCTQYGALRLVAFS